jgi:hypothetical protein
VIDGMEILEFADIGDGVDIAADGPACEGQRVEVAFAAGGVYGIVDGVVADGAGNSAGDDSFKRAGTRYAAVSQGFEQKLGRRIIGGDVGAGKTVGDADMREDVLLERVIREGREAGAVLVVILDELRVDADFVAANQGRLLRLVKFVERGKHGEAGADRPIQEIRLGEAKHQVALVLADLAGKSEGFAEAEEVVGLVGEADEATSKAADAALQADGLFTLFPELEEEIDGPGFGVALDFDGLIGVDLVEIVELVDAQDT